MNADTIRGALAASPPKFNPGRIVMTPGAIEVLANNNELVSTYLVKHASGEWGKLNASDKRENDKALKTGLRILSAYELPKGDTIWIITEAVDIEAGDDPLRRHLTTVLLPSEY